MKGLKRTLTVFGVIVLIILVCVGTVFGVRAYNANKYPVTSTMANEEDRSAYPTNDRITPIEGKYLNGFHFTPKKRTHPGTVVVYGGSEGSPAYWQAQELSEHGFEVLALYFFGQENQKPTLADIPLEQFDEVVDYIKKNVKNPTPISAMGISKGAEFTATLAARGYPIDNLINLTPADHNYPGLDFSSQDEKPSFTQDGQPVPFATFRAGDPKVGFKLMWDGITGYPTEYRPSYENAAANADAGTEIDLSKFKGHALFLAGDQDKMWQGDVATQNLVKQSSKFESVIYKDAGHIFTDDIEKMGNGWQIMFGGTVDGNAAAADESMKLIVKRLSAWHKG